MLIVTVVDLDLEAAENSMIHQLLEMETEHCDHCKEVYEAYPGWLPIHCNHCRKLRGEQWYNGLRVRAKSLFGAGALA